MRKPLPNKPVEEKKLRCAIYTRKSTEDGLEQEFNSLDAQRESAEAYVASQKQAGWVCIPTKYDDGGFTGGNMDRPALKRLIADIEAGEVEVVLVYKVDRLSRSLLDFARIMEVFDKQGIIFVSITQHFNTSTSLGRLSLHLVMTFAEYERELIRERTRDKIAATRRKGKWTGGIAILGYQFDVATKRMLVHPDEATQVRKIFDLYLEHQSLLPVVTQVNLLGWQNKQSRTIRGKSIGGKPFDRPSIHRVLTNPFYLGKVPYKKELFAGEHEAIIPEEIWQKTQELLQGNRLGNQPWQKNEFGFLLKGIMRCECCNCAMTPSHTTRSKVKRYRYYTCIQAQKKGWQSCPSKSIPAEQVERIVLSKIRELSADPDLVKEVFHQLQNQAERKAKELALEQQRLERELIRWQEEWELLSDPSNPTFITELERLKQRDDLKKRIKDAQSRFPAIEEELHELKNLPFLKLGEQKELHFDTIWSHLSPAEQARLVTLMVQEVGYDGEKGKLRITLYPEHATSVTQENAA